KVIIDRAALQQLQQEAASKEKLEIGLVRASELVSSDEGRAKAEGRPQYSLTLALDGASVDHLGQGEITVAVPYALQTNEHPYAVVVYSVNEQGELELVDGGTKLATNQVEFTMTSGATLIIG